MKIKTTLVILLLFNFYLKAQDNPPRKSPMEISMELTDKQLSEKELIELFEKTKENALSEKSTAILYQYNLGMMYYEGKGTSKNLQLAFIWIKRAANGGVIGAMENLGYMYYNGEGTLKSYKDAYKWINKGIGFGMNAKPYYHLGIMCFHGNGVAEDKNKAAMFIKKASDAAFWNGYREKVEKFWNDNELWKYE